ncbi:exopolysaccharide biosynthesis protein [Modicisalibacter luteus]|jgi:hypothetical protein|uniref:Exopolysaccharide biosynthesis protein n=1 Tax=Modicisalibacter luteus TaxID=453962 RepID=A0ABV7M206_9GAMM|nr:exopolysaccharide biosynthesis protein [Halomonas lutea]GHA93105.1 ABC transporter permease [Halomonas lutea]
MTRQKALTDLLKQLDGIPTSRRIHLQDIIDNFNSRGFGPLLVLPGLIVLLPTGAIPGVPSLCGLFIAMVAGQLVLGKSSPWLPRRLGQRGFDHDKFHRGVKWVTPWTARFDKLLKPRMMGLVNPLSRRLVAVLAVILALSMIPLELLPFAAAIPALAIVLMGLGLVADDGLMLMLGIAAVVIGGFAIWRWLLPMS